MSLIEKFIQKINFKNLIIISSFIIVFYLWDFGAKYNLNIDTRYLTLLPLLFFINIKYLKNNDFILIYFIIACLIFQYIYNFFLYKKGFSLLDLKYFAAFVLTISTVVLCKQNILINKNKICNFIILLSPLIILTSNVGFWNEIDRLWQCSLFNSQSKIFNIFFLENSHYAMVAIPALLLNIYYLSKKFNYFNFTITFIFFCSLILFQSTTMIVGMILNIILILFFNIKSFNFKFISTLIAILFFFVVIFTNIYGCSRKISDLLFHTYIMSIQQVAGLESKLKNYENNKLKNDENNNQEIALVLNTKILISKSYINIYKKTAYETKIKKEILNKSQIENFSKLDPTGREKIFHKINVSSQVAKNSFEIALKTIIEKPFGVGLNRFEDAFTDQIKSQSTNFSYEVTQINLNDGASNLGKLIAEFGILSFVLFGYIFVFLFSKKVPIENKLFLFPIVLTQLLRGAGYFNGGFLVSMILIILIVNDSKKKK